VSDEPRLIAHAALFIDILGFGFSAAFLIVLRSKSF
jgi:hypothetical protein